MTNIKTGDLIRKTFKYTVSKIFPDGALVSQSFGTEIERVCDTEEEEAALTAYVYKRTIDEMQDKSKSSPVTKVIFKGIQSQLKKEEKRDNALKVISS